MQTVAWSKEEIVNDFKNCNDLRDIIAKIESDFWERGEVICEIRVNDLFLEEKDEHRFAGSTLQSINKLEVKSQRPDELIEDSLNSIVGCIPQVKRVTLATAEDFRSGRLPEGRKRFSELLDGCHWLTDAFGLLKKVIIKGDPAMEVGWQKAESSLSSAIREVLQAFEGQDYVWVSDVLEYDLVNSLDQWLEITERKMKPV